jgi:hypothetical protein
MADAAVAYARGATSAAADATAGHFIAQRASGADRSSAKISNNGILIAGVGALARATAPRPPGPAAGPALRSLLQAMRPSPAPLRRN